MSIGKTALSFVLFVSACASTPPADESYQAIFGYAVEPVREAAVAAVTEVAHPMSVVRTTDEGSVFTEGWVGACGREVACAGEIGFQGNPGSRMTPWATIEVHFRELGAGTAAEVEIAFEDCDPGVDCQPELLGSTGALERRILDGIRQRLGSPTEDGSTDL